MEDESRFSVKSPSDSMNSESGDGSEMSNQTFSVYILKSNPSVLSQAETFLRNRNWIVGSGTNMREALAYIIQKTPQYVILSADHPNKKVKVLPKLLTQAFPVRVIAGNAAKQRAKLIILVTIGA